MNKLVPNDTYDAKNPIMSEFDQEMVLEDFKKNLEKKHGFKILETLH